MSDDPKVTILPFGKRGVKPIAVEEMPERIPVVPIGREWSDQNWYIARTRTINTPPNKKPVDVLAVEELAELGIDAWYLTEKKKLRTAEKKLGRKASNKLLYRGYVFFSLDAESDDFAKVLASRHIKAILLDAENKRFVPQRVPQKLMDAIFFKADMEANPIEIGESVTIKNGHLAHWDAEVERIINTTKIEVVLNSIASKPKFIISLDSIERL